MPLERCEIVDDEVHYSRTLEAARRRVPALAAQVDGLELVWVEVRGEG